ncbi:mitochondrial fission ELM1 family protein [Marinobacter psychrophilus]|jgi:mitochondrial fission protein ELM1|uniref:mitochondrial fission ELM1 family protein n=1 Tax=Marinobacter psychrophilus TaxID=330734 RepID=UPI001B61A384|nr:mitochondrial fission ELM1 family protein [Marinobacter psychrophilus]MBQ0844205.1 mitochondrial fission ELM1 family protein [Marinobacter psychrophilus]
MAENANTSCPVIWLLTDNKSGHRNQLKGLGNRLRVLAGASLHWIDVSTVETPLWRVLLGRPPALDPALTKPDLIIAAGSGSHRLLLALRKVKGARTLVLMKPGFPLRWVSGAIIPQHDRVKPGPNLFLTQGAINAITPVAEPSTQPRGLILVGGPSAHFFWSDDTIMAQIHELLHNYPKWSWIISSSRRTPASCQQALAALETSRIQVLTPQDTGENWLSTALAHSRCAWITPDSMSMVCEAATSGVPTGVFQLPAKRRSRVALGLATMQDQHLVTTWDDHYKVMTARPGSRILFWQADAAARWVMTHFLPTGPKP